MPVEESCFTQRRFLRPLLVLESAKFLHFCPGSGDLCGVRLTICQTLSDFNGPEALLIGELMPNMATAGTNEQPQLTVAGLAPQVLQHRLLVGTRHPLRLVHRLALRYFASV